MGVSQELILASAISEDPTKLVAVIPAAIVGIGAAAKSFAIVHQSEMGVRTRKGAPMIKPEIYQGIVSEICDELPERKIRCLSQFGQLPKNERRERIKEKIAELDDEITEQGIYRIVGQGIVWLTPFIDRVVRINVADQTTPLEPFELEGEEDRLDRQVLIKPSVTWNVRSDQDNPYKALFNINNEKDAKLKTQTQELEQTVSWICAQGLGMVLRGKNYNELKNFDPESITKHTQELCRDGLLRYGVNLSQVWLKSVARTPAERLGQSIELGSGSVDPGIAAAAIASSGKDGKGGGRLLNLVRPDSDDTDDQVS